MKEIYESPIFDLVEYETEDVITNSTPGKDNDVAVDPWNNIVGK